MIKVERGMGSGTPVPVVEERFEEGEDEGGGFQDLINF